MYVLWKAWYIIKRSGIYTMALPILKLQWHLLLIINLKGQAISDWLVVILF